MLFTVFNTVLNIVNKSGIVGIIVEVNSAPCKGNRKWYGIRLPANNIGFIFYDRIELTGNNIGVIFL